MDAHPRTRAPGNHRRRRNESATASFPQRSSCLLLQILSVETNSFLPDQQSDRSNFPGQREPCHRWFHSASHHGGIEILQRSRGDRGSDGRALKDIFSIVVVIQVQPTNRNVSLRSPELSLDIAVLTAAVGLQTKTAVGPELSLGAKTMRRLDKGHQQGRSNRTDRGNLAQQLSGGMLLAFEQEVVLHFTMQCPQRIDLLIVELRPAAHAWFADLVQPLLAMACGVDSLTNARNGPTPVERFQTPHHPG